MLLHLQLLSIEGIELNNSLLRRKERETLNNTDTGNSSSGIASVRESGRKEGTDNYTIRIKRNKEKGLQSITDHREVERIKTIPMAHIPDFQPHWPRFPHPYA